MTYAPAEFEVIQQLTGFRLTLFLAVRHEEFLDGACKLSPAELSRKYTHLSNESNTARVRKQMIKEGWFIETPGGIVTKKFNTTANFAVNEESAPEETANFAVIFYYLLQILQSDTAKFAGTGIAKKDLNSKQNSSQENTQDARAREYPLKELYDAFPDIVLMPAQEGFILADVKTQDKAAWLATIKKYQQNHDPERNRYMPEKVGNLLSVFKAEKQKLEKKHGRSNENSEENGQGRNGHHRTEGKSDSQTARSRVRARPPA